MIQAAHAAPAPSRCHVVCFLLRLRSVRWSPAPPGAACARSVAHERGAAEVAAQLAAYGVECARVLFPHGQDACAYALTVTPPEKSLGVVLRAALSFGEMGKGKVSADVSSHGTRAPSSLAAEAAKAADVRAAEIAAPVPPAEPQKAARCYRFFSDHKICRTERVRIFLDWPDWHRNS